MRLPRADIRPLDIIVEHDGQFTRLAPLPELWLSDGSAPVPKDSPPGPNVKDVSSSQLKGRFGIQALVQAIGKIGLQLSGQQEFSIQLVARDTIITDCSFSDLQTFVERGSLNSEVPASRFFYDDSNRVWLITEVISSGKLDIVIGESSEAEASARAAELTETLSANLGVESISKSGNTITYSRKPALV